MNILFIFLSLLSHAFADSKDDCLNAEWNQTDSRTQGGGWIWFPGKGTSSSTLEDAYLKAEGLAISRMIQECEAPHKESRINERCDYQDGLEYKAYVRVAILDAKCREIKYGDKSVKERATNPELQRTYSRYLEKVGAIQNHSGSRKDIDCSKYPPEKCLSIGRLEYGLENYSLALEYFDDVCRNEVQTGCFNAGLASWMLRKNDKAIGYFSLPCKQNDAQACYFKGKLLFELGISIGEAKNILRKSCSLKNGKACFEIGKISESEKQLSEAEDLYTKACVLKISDACHNGSRLLYDLGEIEKSSRLSKMGCEHKLAKPCFNYAFLTVKKNKPLAVEYFKKACDFGMPNGCERAGDHSPDKSFRHKIYLKGCRLGGKDSCHKSALLALDSSDNNNFKKYSEEACVLGAAKACYNLSLLSKKSGNASESERYRELACNDKSLPQCSDSDKQKLRQGPSSCMKDEECSEKHVCATIKGEYPGVCTQTGFGILDNIF